MVTICKECEFAERLLPKGVATGIPVLTGQCLNTDAPIYEYVQGLRNCNRINHGDCKFFKPMLEIPTKVIE